MKEKRFYQVLVIVLVILNVGIISFFLLTRNPPQERGRKRMDAMRMFDRRLDLSASQKQNFDSLRQSHFNQIREVQQNIMQNKRILYREMKSGVVDQGRVDSLTLELGMLHRQMERVTFHHFREMREQLEPQQAEKFDSLLVRIFRKEPRGRDFHGRHN